jgi:ABC-type nitrate/sulfonate/bicarbonate transport system substrate-binding protein
MNKSSRLLFIGAVLLVMLAAMGCPKPQHPQPTPQSNEPVKITFGYRPISPSIDWFVAMDKGYFADAGLEVETEMFMGSDDLADAVMSGRIEFATDLGSITQLIPMMRTGDISLRFLSLDLDALDSPMRGPTIVVKPDSGITSIEDLRGKTIGVFPGINFKIFLEAALAAHGLNVDQDVNVIQIPPQEQMTGFTSVDALLSLDPILSGLEVQAGALPLEDRLSARYIFDNFPAAASCVNAEYAEQHPEMVDKVVEVLNRGIDFVREHPEETVESLAKWTELSVEIVATMEPVKYAKLDEINLDELQAAIDYLVAVPWLNLENGIDARQIVWTMHSD